MMPYNMFAYKDVVPSDEAEMPSFDSSESSSGLTSSSQLVDTTSNDNFHINDSTSANYEF